MSMWVYPLVAVFPALYLSNRIRKLNPQPIRFMVFNTVLFTFLLSGIVIVVFVTGRDAAAQISSPAYDGEVVDFNVILTTPYVGYRGPATEPSYERVVQYVAEDGTQMTVATFRMQSEEPTLGTQVRFYLLGEQAYEPTAGRYFGALVLLAFVSGITFVFYKLSAARL